MPALPAVSDFTGADRTNAQMKVTHGALHAYLVGLLGTDGVPATALAALGALGAPGVTTRTAATVLVPGDRGRLIQATSGTWALTLPAAATAGAGWSVLVVNSGTGVVTLTRAGSDLIDGAATVALPAGIAVLVLGTGTSWVTLTLGGAASAGRALRASDLQTSATDAAAGRVLTAGAFGLGVTGNVPLLANIDAVDTATGFYRTTSAGTAGIFPSGANPVGHLIMHRHNATTAWQMFTPVGNAGVTAGRLWHRVYNPTTSSWLPWRRIYDQGSVLGTVSQSGGVPTEALIETNTNANGRWTRFADGTQICTHIIATSNSAGVTWTFPAAFSDSAGRRLSAVPVASVLCSAVLDSAPNTTDATFSVRGAGDVRLAVSLHVTAIGRWF